MGYKYASGTSRNDRRDALVKALKKAAASADTEAAHHDADRALIKYINDPYITRLYNKVDKWYS